MFRDIVTDLDIEAATWCIEDTAADVAITDMHVAGMVVTDTASFKL